MKKFVFLYCGFGEPTQETKDAWGKWFASIKNKLVDGGNPFGPGKEVTRAGTKELPNGLEAITGYSIINADSMDDAVKLLVDCPMGSSVRVYEAMSM